ncbi:unnamed protein product [Prunus armeniaca]
MEFSSYLTRGSSLWHSLATPSLTNLKNRGYPDEESGGQEKSRTTQEQGNSKLVFWKLETALQFSFNYNLIFVLSLAFNLTNLKSRDYLDEELGGQEKSITTQEQGNSKLNFWKLETALATELVTCKRWQAGDGPWWWQVAGGRIPVGVAGGGIPVGMAGGKIPARVVGDRWPAVVVG